MQKITPFLWFDSQAEEAAKLYVSIFKNSKIINLQRFAGPEGKAIVTGTFELDGQQFMALQAGPLFKFTEATSAGRRPGPRPAPDAGRASAPAGERSLRTTRLGRDSTAPPQPAR